MLLIGSNEKKLLSDKLKKDTLLTISITEIFLSLKKSQDSAELCNYLIASWSTSPRSHCNTIELWEKKILYWQQQHLTTVANDTIPAIP